MQANGLRRNETVAAGLAVGETLHSLFGASGTHHILHSRRNSPLALLQRWNAAGALGRGQIKSKLRVSSYTSLIYRIPNFQALSLQL